jgi:hypothetical protein
MITADLLAHYLWLCVQRMSSFTRSNTARRRSDGRNGNVSHAGAESSTTVSTGSTRTEVVRIERQFGI